MCSYKEITSSYSEINQPNVPHSMPNAIIQMYFKEAWVIKNCDSYKIKKHIKNF